MVSQSLSDKFLHLFRDTILFNHKKEVHFQNECVKSWEHVMSHWWVLICILLTGIILTINLSNQRSQINNVCRSELVNKSFGTKVKFGPAVFHFRSDGRIGGKFHYRRFFDLISTGLPNITQSTKCHVIF